MPLLGRDPGYLVRLEVPEYLIRSEEIKRITQVGQVQHFISVAAHNIAPTF